MNDQTKKAMKNKFEDYLRQLHANQYEGFDDNMYDDFEKWLLELDGNDLIGLAGKCVDDFVAGKIGEIEKLDSPLEFSETSFGSGCKIGFSKAINTIISILKK